MSGSGRKSQYRKSVAADYLEEDRCPEAHEHLATIVGNRGAGLFELQLCSAESSAGTVLAKLPRKFHKLVWVKRGDAVIVGEEQGAYTINHVLSKANVKYLKESGVWKDVADGATAPTPASVGRDCVLIASEDLMPGYDSQSEDEAVDEEVHSSEAARTTDAVNSSSSGSADAPSAAGGGNSAAEA